jgi:hypothetical protein
MLALARQMPDAFGRQHGQDSKGGVVAPMKPDVQETYRQIKELLDQLCVLLTKVVTVTKHLAELSCSTACVEAKETLLEVPPAQREELLQLRQKRCPM